MAPRKTTKTKRPRPKYYPDATRRRRRSSNPEDKTAEEIEGKRNPDRPFAARANAYIDSVLAFDPTPTSKPKHVAIVALGPSSDRYFYLARCMGSRRALADETWGINAYGDVAQCDLIVHMDDFQVQEIRAKARPDSNIAHMIEAFRSTSIPIMTCRKYPGYPTSFVFPLQDVLNNLGFAYFNNTVPYAIAYALHRGVEKISLYGVDYTYANSHDAEKGRACCEFWISKAIQLGVEVVIPAESSLLDSNVPEDQQLYGFCDTQKVTIVTPGGGAPATVVFSHFDKKIPTAEEIEKRYDHTGKL